MLEAITPTRRWTLESWLSAYEQGRIEMSPDIRTRSTKGDVPVVGAPSSFSLSESQHLVDTVLKNWDMPKFYVLDFTRIAAPPHGLPNPSRRPYAIVDGRARLEALFSFMRDGFPLAEDRDPKTVLVTNPGGSPASVEGMYMSGLAHRHPAYANRVLKHEPTVVSVVTDSADDLEAFLWRLAFGRFVRD